MSIKDEVEDVKKDLESIKRKSLHYKIDEYERCERRLVVSLFIACIMFFGLLIYTILLLNGVH